MKKTLLTIAFFTGAFAAVALDSGVWDFSSNNDMGWVAARNLTPTVENGILALDITGGDSSIGNYNVDVDPQKVSGFIVKYRATGLPDNTTGQIFIGSESKDFCEDNQFYLPSLISDNQWHELKVTVEGSFKSGMSAWKSFGKITKIRLDMVDQFPGKIEIKFIKLVQ